MSHRFPIITSAAISWRDGQPYSEHFKDIYFSQDNGLAQKKHVFIEGSQLNRRWQNLSTDHFVVAEAGFGTGLNFLLTWQEWLKYGPASATLFYYSCEKYPLSKDDLQKALLLWPNLAALAEELISHYPQLLPGVHPISFAEGRIQLCLMWGDVVATFRELLSCGDLDLEAQLRKSAVDAWYLDGFSPKKNITMWSNDFFKVMRLLSTDKTTVASYTVAHSVRSELEQQGFAVQRRVGYGKKRYCLVATYDASADNFPKKHRFLSTPWHTQLNRAIPPLSQRKAIIVGAGLAGCYTAHALAKRNWQVLVLDTAHHVASGASGNTAAVLYPKLTVFQSPLNQLMLTAFLYALRVYPLLLQQGVKGQLKGMFQWASSEREVATHRELAAWLYNKPDLAEIVDVERARLLTKLSLHEGGLWIPHTGWINMRTLCAFLIQHPNIVFHGGRTIDDFQWNNGWQVGGEKAPVVILACGDLTTDISYTDWLPIKRMRGQTTTFYCAEDQALPIIPVCGKGHMLATDNRTLVYGATYHQQESSDPWFADPLDTKLNHQQLLKMPVDWSFSGEVVDNWGGIRAAAPDYCPIVGPVVKPDSFHRVYKKLTEDRRYFVGQTAEHYPGLYVCTGFGSRGLTTIPLMAEWLAGHIHQEPSLLPLSLIKSIAPSRFLLKKS